MLVTGGSMPYSTTVKTNGESCYIMTPGGSSSAVAGWAANGSCMHFVFAINGIRILATHSPRWNSSSNSSSKEVKSFVKTLTIMSGENTGVMAHRYYELLQKETDEDYD